MSCRKTFAALLAACLATVAFAADDPRDQRHELMEGVGEAAKVIGEMMKGERAYDVDAVMNSLDVFDDASSYFGELFPEGSETGNDTEAAPAIWEDRAGFEEALKTWRGATIEAIKAEPATLEEAKPLLGAVFNACKNCHDTYRIKDE